MTESFIVRRPDVDLCVYDLGGSGAPVVFAHAASFNAMMWKPIANEILESHRCFLVDMRGHGASIPLIPKSMKWDLMAEDLVTVVAEIKARVETTEAVHVVGHSMGGTTFLMAETLNPGLIRSAWMYEPVLFSTDTSEREEVTQMLYEGTLRRKPGFESIDSARDRFTSKPPMEEFDRECLDLFLQYGLIERDGQVWLACTPEVEAQVYLGAGTGVTASLDTIDFPIKFVVGEDDGDRVPAILGFAAALKTQVEKLDGLGHFGPFIAPKRLAASLKNWLAEVDANLSTD